MAKTVVILGGSYAGLHVAHYLLKQKIPDVKVILVSKSSHFYWNMASVRAIVPGQLKDEQLFEPLTAAFERYPKDKYELVIGAADKVDVGSKTVQVTPAGPGEEAPKTLSYDHLVVATGSRSTGPVAVPWKVLNSHDETVAALDTLRSRVEAAKHIVVAGAGATGVEVAGELGFEYGSGAGAKEIHLLSGGMTLLDGDSVGPAALAELGKLHVKTRFNARVTGAKELPDGKTEVTLADGETITTDLYLPTMGLQANSEMLDQKYLGETGYVKVNEFWQVESLEDEGVWALGDVVSSPRAGFMYTQKQAAGVGKNLALALQGKQPQRVKLLPVDLVACAVGRSRGAGRMGSVKMFSLMVWLAKGKTLGIQRLPGYIDGSVA